MHRLSEFIVGLLFGLGLLLSGMTDPGKVLGFLDLFGQWDPSLAFVMGGAILVGFFAFAVAKTRTTNFLGGALNLPKSNVIDKRLVIGSLLFGAGWGLAGCGDGTASSGPTSDRYNHPASAPSTKAAATGAIRNRKPDRPTARTTTSSDDRASARNSAIADRIMISGKI